jgi:hypothetical protein
MAFYDNIPGLWDPSRAAANPELAAAVRAGPGGLPASPYAGTGPAGGSTFTDMLNGLSGSMPDINNAIQSLAYGIGSFAKDPRKREMYIQAALAHQQHMSADKAAHLKTLQDHGNQILEFIANSGGDPKVLNLLQPVVEHHAQAVAALGGKDAAAQFLQLAQVAQAMPPAKKELGQIYDPKTNTYSYGVPKEGDLAKPGDRPPEEKPPGEFIKDKSGNWVLNQDWIKAHAAVAAAGRAPPAPDRTMVPIYDPSPDNPTHQKLIPRDQYAGQPTGSVQQPSMAGIIAPILEKVAKGQPLTPEQYKAYQMYAQTTPRAQMEQDVMGGGPALTTTTPVAPPASLAAPTAPISPAPASPQSNLGTSQDAPVPVDNSNAETVARGVAASGTPVWAKGPDGKVEQITPEQARAWLKQHGLQ